MKTRTPAARNLKISKKRLSRYLDSNPPRYEVKDLADAYRRTINYCLAQNIKVPLVFVIGLKRFETYLGYRVN